MFISLIMPHLGESGILWQCTLTALIADVMVITPLGWKAYRGVDKPFSLWLLHWGSAKFQCPACGHFRTEPSVGL